MNANTALSHMKHEIAIALAANLGLLMAYVGTEASGFSSADWVVLYSMAISFPLLYMSFKGVEGLERTLEGTPPVTPLDLLRNRQMRGIIIITGGGVLSTLVGLFAVFARFSFHLVWVSLGTLVLAFVVSIYSHSK